MFLMYATLRALMIRAASSVSKAEDMTAFMTYAIIRTTPLLGGYSLSFNGKNLSAQLLTFEFLR